MKNYVLPMIVLLAITTSLCQAQTKSPTLWGMTIGGGAPNSGDGYIFKTNDTGTVKYEHQFGSGSDGISPYSSLVKASDGLLYGTASHGGTNGEGIIFSYNISTGNYSDVYNFSGYPNDGSGPGGPLMQASNGLLYGMTVSGGANEYGTIFSYNINAGKETDIHDFGSDTDGKSPQYGALIQAKDSLLYGMTAGGGDKSDGIIFSYNIKTGAEKNVLSFDNGNNGDGPTGSLMQASDSLLYGMTMFGGTKDDGSFFSYNITKNSYTDIHDFGTTGDGQYPGEGALIQANDSLLYGMTIQGGANDDGMIFSYNASTSAYTDVHDFGSGTDGENPYGSLMQASNGLLYGMTQNGGVNTHGTIFSFNDTTNNETDIHDFAYNDTTGDIPDGSLIEDDSFIVVNTPVWPGDANDDLTVNVFDLLSLGLYYEQTGPARDTTNDNTWAPHPAANWGVSQYNGYDLKYADCNGDGVINIDDAAAILLNYGDTHPTHSPRSSSKERSGGVPLYFIADSTSYHGGSNVHVSVWLGNSTNPATNIYGLGYFISLDTSLIETGTLTFDNDSSFIGTTTDTSALSLTHIGDDVETAVVGTNHTDKSGYGKIGDLYFTINSSITNPQFLLSVSDWQSIDAEGDTLTLQPESDTLNVTTGINQLSVNTEQLSIYPNPSDGEIDIVSTNTIDNLKITNLLGQLIYKGQPKQTQVSFDIKETGMYFVTVTLYNETITQKIIISK